MATQTLSPAQSEELLGLLKARFEKHPHRHRHIEWADVHAKLQQSPRALWSLNEMEITGGEPDVVGYDEGTGEYIFYDCSPESPKGRRSICYDHQALESRKEHKPADSALNMAADMGVELLNEQQYRELQQLGAAIFCDRRYNQVFTYHNGAESYYAARGFRGMVRV
ncbi:DUF4256 domain-containing protein [Mucilaginibacter lutimaris]|uniref:DUF4256 domain-containing protein n=1 Tax=Mucilaginibacter lutimaris TaxID=931629 RepID=A0ABW2ZM06_9SPHI